MITEPAMDGPDVLHAADLAATFPAPLPGDLRYAPAVMMQLLYLHKILQSQHPDPPRVRMPPLGLNWGIFKRRF